MKQVTRKQWVAPAVTVAMAKDAQALIQGVADGQFSLSTQLNS